MSHVSAKDWQAFVLGLYRLDKPPNGFLSPDKYAKRWGGTMSQQKIKDDLSRGKIPKRWAIQQRYGKQGKTKALIHWDSTVNQYALNLPPELRPSGFDPKKTFRPFNGPEWVPPMPHEVADQEIKGNGKPQKLSIGGIDNLEEAKLQVEKLKILKMQAEIMEANNKTIRMDDVISAVTAWGVEVRGAWLSAKNRMKGELASCKTQQECDKVLENGFKGVWDILGSPPDMTDGESEAYGSN